MIKTLVLLVAALALAQARPEDLDLSNVRLHEPHPDCPPTEVHYLLPHEYDCTKFYYCEYGLKFIEPRDCAPGTEFNAEIQVCVHPASSGCTLGGGGTTSGPVTAAPSTAAPSTAAPVTVAPTAPATTQAPITAAPTQAPTTAAPTQAPITAAPTQAPQPTTSAPASTSNPGDCEILDNGCPANFSIHKLLPHEEYCHKFYQCDNGQLVLKYCAVGTYFNPELEVCDWPHNVDCVNDGSYEYPSTSAPIVNPTTPGGNDIGDILDNGCPADFDVHHLLPHETECNKFYYCVFGEKVERSCAPGTYFNYEIQVCDWPENVDCASSGSTNRPTGAPGDSSEEILIPDDPIEWDPLPNGCPSNFEVHHLLPHESDCEKFYYCVHGQKVERDCPAGTHFNPVEQVCDWPQYAGCAHWEGGCTGPADGCDSSTSRPTVGPVTDGPTSAPITDGPTSGPVTNAPVTEGPTPGPVPVNKCSNECNVLPWAHDSACDRYWICNGNQPALITCSLGLHFNPSTNTCDFICNSGCVRNNVQATAEYNGVNVFLPWDKVDENVMQLLKLD